MLKRRNFRWEVSSTLFIRLYGNAS